MVEICHLLLVINSSLNFPIYFMASGSRFRDILSCWRLRESSPVSYSSAFIYSTSTLMIPLQVWPPTPSPQLSYNSTNIPPKPACCTSPIIHKEDDIQAQPASLFTSSNNSFFKPSDDSENIPYAALNVPIVTSAVIGTAMPMSESAQPI